MNSGNGCGGLAPPKPVQRKEDIYNLSIFVSLSLSLSLSLSVYIYIYIYIYMNK